MLGRDALLPFLDGLSEALRDRLDRRVVAQVLDPLLGGRADTLLLLLNVGHLRTNARDARAPRWYQSRFSHLGRKPAPMRAVFITTIATGRRWAVPVKVQLPWPREADGRRSYTRPRGKAGLGRRLAWSTAIFSLATGLSRILGLVREIVAAYFGTRGAINAFTVAFQIPNLIRAIVADAALSSAFVPVFTELHEKGERERAWRVASSLIWLLLLGLSALTALFILLAPLIIPLFGLPASQEDLAVHLSQILFPDHRPARDLRDRRRDPEQLRALHGAALTPVF